MSHIGFALVVLGALGIGAWLVVAGHPWFGLLAMLLAGSARMSDDPKEASLLAPKKEEKT